jgi:hypothetical protein
MIIFNVVFCWLVYFKKYAVLVKCLWEKNICWVVIIVSHDLPFRECKIFVRWKIFVRFKKYLVNARGWGQNGHFASWTHLSELTNSANLTDYGRNGFGVKKIWLSGLDVQPNFLVACVSNTSFLMACVSKSLFSKGKIVCIRTRKQAQHCRAPAGGNQWTSDLQSGSLTYTVFDICLISCVHFIDYLHVDL